MDANRATSKSSFVAEETEGIDLGDKRLAARLAVIMSTAIEAPSDSFPKMAGSDAALEATYRFLNNPRVGHAGILAPHVRSTVRRVRAAQRVVVAHDSTQFSFGPLQRADLDRIGKGATYGLEVHVSLAVAEGGVPLGVLAARPFVRPFGEGRKLNGLNKSKPSNITHRWGEQVRAVRAHLGGDAEVIHVMDREADDYALLSQLVESEERFVIRQAGNRRLDPAKAEPKARSLLASVPVIARRDAEISERRKPTKKRHMTRGSLRKARTATLEVRATRMSIKRSVCAGGLGADSVQLNLVEVREVNPPAEITPVEWWLWTTEPIGTDEEVVAVIDAYRMRWTIEEYFKALKSGCRFEQRQLESRHALLNALAILAPVAWRLLLLRSLARELPNVPATIALTPLQLKALHGYRARKKLPPLRPDLTAQEAMLAVAGLGGHISNNGPPGWMVLGRGLDRLLDIELGLGMALEAMGAC